MKKTAELNRLWSYLIVEELVRNDITYFCISPGSRSTPLTIAVAENQSAEKIICYDERGAAFHAVGYARATEKPAVLICTSGTAVANYFPAIVEAKQDSIPLIILSADRPPELHDTGTNQTIDQIKIFSDYLNWQFNLPVPDENITNAMILSTVDQAVYRSMRSPFGPVHINCMLREPLASEFPPSSFLFNNNIKNWTETKTPYTKYEQQYPVLNDTQLKKLAVEINASSKGIILAGRLKNKTEAHAVLKLAKKINWPVFADISSNIRFLNSADIIIDKFDLLLLSEKIKNKLKAEIILHIGRQLVSKRLLNFLSTTAPEKYILVNDDPKRYDPVHIVSNRFEADIQQFCKKLMPYIQIKSEKDWLYEIIQANQKVNDLTDSLNTNQINEVSIAQYISKIIPNKSGLFLASSMPIRDMDMYAVKSDKQVTVGSNRGASGIDGTIASAAGFTRGLKSPVTLVIGDLAFIHDLNSLALLSTLTYPLIIILINNHGSGIFSFLPISKHKNVFEKYFVTPHSFGFKHAAKLFKINYFYLNSTNDFTQIYNSCLKKQKSAVIEVETSREENYKLHKQLESQIVKVLEN